MIHEFDRRHDVILIHYLQHHHSISSRHDDASACTQIPLSPNAVLVVLPCNKNRIMYRIIVVVFITVVFGASLTVTASSLTPITLNATTFYTALMDDIIIDSTTTTGSSRNKQWLDVIVNVRDTKVNIPRDIYQWVHIGRKFSLIPYDRSNINTHRHCTDVNIVVSSSIVVPVVVRPRPYNISSMRDIKVNCTMVWVYHNGPKRDIHYGSTTSLSYQPVRRIRQ